jgi:hypothetical protein
MRGLVPRGCRANATKNHATLSESRALPSAKASPRCPAAVLGQPGIVPVCFSVKRPQPPRPRATLPSTVVTMGGAYPCVAAGAALGWRATRPAPVESGCGRAGTPIHLPSLIQVQLFSPVKTIHWRKPTTIYYPRFHPAQHSHSGPGLFLPPPAQARSSHTNLPPSRYSHLGCRATKDPARLPFYALGTWVLHLSQPLCTPDGISITK